MAAGRAIPADTEHKITPMEAGTWEVSAEIKGTDKGRTHTQMARRRTPASGRTTSGTASGSSRGPMETSSMDSGTQANASQEFVPTQTAV